ncbi:hypothetical protein XNC3_1100003 [Xenorhabdus nematophila F1]|nr:hypothetical protein XNC3_1100003 [Xenorhabdus nematophila F1]
MFVILTVRYCVAGRYHVELLQERALCSALRLNAPRSEPVIRANASIS